MFKQEEDVVMLKWRARLDDGERYRWGGECEQGS